MRQIDNIIVLTTQDLNLQSENCDLRMDTTLNEPTAYHIAGQGGASLKEQIRLSSIDSNRISISLAASFHGRSLPNISYLVDFEF